MSSAMRLSNALDRPVMGTESTLSNALDKVVRSGFSRPPGAGAPPGSRATDTHPEGPVQPALRRFGVRTNAEEVSHAT